MPHKSLITLKARLQRAPPGNVRVAPTRSRKQQRPASLPHVLLTMHRETVGLIDDHKVLVLVDKSSAQRLSKHVGVDALQLLCEPQ